MSSHGEVVGAHVLHGNQGTHVQWELMWNTDGGRQSDANAWVTDVHRSKAPVRLTALLQLGSR